MGMGFQFEQHRLGLWDLSWDLKKTISWEMGLGAAPPPPLYDPHLTVHAVPLFDGTRLFSDRQIHIFKSKALRANSFILLIAIATNLSKLSPPQKNLYLYPI